MSDEKGKLCFIQLKDTTAITATEGTTEDTEEVTAATKEDSEDTEASATDGDKATSTIR